MRYRLIALASLLLGAASVISCIDPDQSQEVIDLENKQQIEDYLEENPMTAAKEFKDVANSVYMFWEVSTDPQVNQLLRLDTVKVNYTGRLLDDKVFDTSIEQVAKDNGIFNSTRTYAPLHFPLGGGVIQGFEFAVSLMRVGEKATVIFPARLGYGSESRDRIPANSPLIFELELVEVKNGPNHN
jgi:FKBP-type peptidyl-prolyl cis-trans isomerase